MTVFVDPQTGERYANVPDDEVELARSTYGLVPLDEYESSAESEAKPLLQSAGEAAQAYSNAMLRPLEAIGRALPRSRSAEMNERLSGGTWGPSSEEARQLAQEHPIASLAGSMHVEAPLSALGGVPGAVARVGAGALLGAGESAFLGGRAYGEYSPQELALFAGLGAVGEAVTPGVAAIRRVLSAPARAGAASKAAASAVGEQVAGAARKVASTPVGKYATKAFVEDAVEQSFKAGGAAIGGAFGGVPGAAAGWVAGRHLSHKYGSNIAQRVWGMTQRAVKDHGSNAAGLSLLAAAALGDEDSDTAGAMAAAGFGLFGRRLLAGASLGARRAGEAIVTGAKATGRGVTAGARATGDALLAAEDAVERGLAATGRGLATGASATGDALAKAGRATGNALALAGGEASQIAGRTAGHVARHMTGSAVRGAVGAALGSAFGPLGSAAGHAAGLYVAPRISKAVTGWLSKRAGQATGDTLSQAVAETVANAAARPALAEGNRIAAEGMGAAIRRQLDAATAETAAERAAALRSMPHRMGGSATGQREALISSIDELTAGLGQLGGETWDGARQFADLAKERITKARSAQERYRIGLQLVETLSEHTALAGDGEMGKVFGAYAERLWETMGKRELWLGKRELERAAKRDLKKRAKLIEQLADGEELAEGLARGPRAEPAPPRPPINPEAVAIGTGLGPVFQRAARELAPSATRAKRISAKRAGQSGSAELPALGIVAAGALGSANLLARAKRRSEESLAFSDLDGMTEEDRVATVRANGDRYAREANTNLQEALSEQAEAGASAREEALKHARVLVPEASREQRAFAAEVLRTLDAVHGQLAQAGVDTAELDELSDELTDIAVAHEQSLPVEHDAGELLARVNAAYEALYSNEARLSQDARATLADLRAGLENPALWGNAADLLGELHAYQDDEGRVSVPVETDPESWRDAVSAYAEAQRGMLDIYERWGVPSERLRETADRLDEAISAGDAVAAEIAAAKLADASEDDGPMADIVGRIATEMPGVDRDTALAVMPDSIRSGIEAGQRAHRYESALQSIQRGSEVTLRRVARGMAGLGAARQVSPDASNEAFTEGYSDETAAFEAKKAVLDQLQQDPLALSEAMSESYGDLASTHPDVYAEMADIAARATRILTNAMPPSMLLSLQQPRGLPPAVDDIRRWSRVYVAVTEPEVYLSELEAGHAWPEQSQAFAQMYPERWSALGREALAAAEARGPSLTPQESTYLDLAFNIGETLGGMWTDRGAQAIRDANAARAQQNQERAKGLGTPKPAAGAPVSATAALSRGPSSPGA